MMQIPEKQSCAVVSLDAERDRRKYIAIAYADENWQQTKASFALSDIALTDEDAERAGRIIAGVMTMDEASADILKKRGISRAP